MKFPRAAGILLHPTCLPGSYGIGDLGPEAYRFADFLQYSGCGLWQVLPLNPTGYGDSPFQCFSAHAGNPLLISLDRLVHKGVLAKTDVEGLFSFPEEHVDYGAVIKTKIPLLRKAAQRFLQSDSAERQKFAEFCRTNSQWLDDFALFMAVKNTQDLVAWPKWPSDIAQRRPDAVREWTTRLASDIEAIKYWQFEFFEQWKELRDYCHQRGIQIIGDIPIYVAHDSADVWANRQFFLLDERGNPIKVAGVPPDYFSATGQLWGNPIYNWDVMRADGYQWWIQ